ncbi:MAG: hypothetical protein GF401_14285 [Chitinivibrionales bacterium]|nr:hypothetical protein [Chitinivibrionales bacterium]
MTIADPVYFEKSHIETCRFDAPAELAEQAVHCLELVAELSDAGLSYQFKGGNSLLLILKKPYRFSIDVDIATDIPVGDIEEILDLCIQKYGAFTHWEPRRHKTKPWIPISSYYLYYNSMFTDPPMTSIMLDIQLRRSPYETRFIPVVCGELYQATVKAELPTPASIIGDKLLTLGPDTLGIPTGKGKDAQRLKHVCDVSTLLDTEPDLDEIRASFFACMEHENELQETASSAGDVLDDTLFYCATAAQYAQKPEPTEEMPRRLIENITGIGPFAGHLFSKDYSWSKLQVDTARVALCITAVCTNKVNTPLFLDALSGKLQPDQELIQNNQLAETNDEAYRLWNSVAEWLGRNPLK